MAGNRPLRVFVDTNVIIDAEDPSPTTPRAVAARRLLELGRTGVVELLAGDVTAVERSQSGRTVPDEVTVAPSPLQLGDARLDHTYLADDDAQARIAALRSGHRPGRTDWTTGRPNDRRDVLCVETAINAAADLLVTEDRKLRTLANTATGIRGVTAAEAVAFIDP